MREEVENSVLKKRDLVFHRFFTLFIKQTCANQGLSDRIGVAVGRRAAVLKVALLLLSHRSWDANTSTTVGHACRELMNAGCFMATSKSSSIVQASLWIIGTDVVVVSLSKLFNTLLNAPSYGETNINQKSITYTQRIK